MIYKIFLSFFCIFLSCGLGLAQNQPSSKVVVSEADLVSLVKILKRHQDENKSTASSSTGFEPKQAENRQNVQVENTRDERLYSEIEEIKIKLNKLLNAPTPQNTVTEPDENQSTKTINNRVQVNSNQKSKNLSSSESETKSKSEDRKDLIKTLDSILESRKITKTNSVKNQISESATSPENNEKILTKLNAQNAIIDSLIQRQTEMELQLSQDEGSPESKIVEKLTYSVFFDHNSHQLDSKYKSNLDRVVAFLKSNPQLDVVLNAYASQTGNAEYNKKLSMLRAEAVKSYLKSKTISPERILSDYHGSDSNTEASSARRVEISYLVQK